ncbi:DUF3180 domain-containing protein [Nakamurella lactea]|uniref:DUF3180 domain-containing protein n=1 Tax=Nakamurella lactea TaxID=459515 RepID=UPI00048F8B07|nr:DUF3180 domain-containing protein [Nakamurella lactea]
MAGQQQQGIGLTRWRDLAVVAVIAALAGYLLVRWNYHRLPPLPRLAGLPAAVIGIGEGIAGWGLRGRIRGRGAAIAPLSVARALTVAKATALAAAAFGGLWIGLLGYVLPLSGEVVAAAGDRTTAVIGVVGALVMLAGALLLERGCVRPPDQPDKDAPPQI